MENYKMTKNFNYYEMINSTTAKKYNIDNNCPSSLIDNLQKTAEMMQSIRDFYGKGITITSGYRCPKLNTKIGGSKTSAHTQGNAVDTKPADCNMKDYQKKVLEWAKINNFDQIIIEKPDKNGIASWIHIGRINNGKQRKQILIYTGGKYVIMK